MIVIIDHFIRNKKVINKLWFILYKWIYFEWLIWVFLYCTVMKVPTKVRRHYKNMKVEEEYY